MQYRNFGNTGVQISALGFGAMRLPMVSDKDNKQHVDYDNAINIIRRAYELGVNYFDTAYFYCEGESEIAVGRAIKGFRDKIHLSTKLPLGKVKSRDDYRRILEEQLKKLNTDYIDFYHFHGLGQNSLDNIVLKHNLLEAAQKAKQEGLIRHISFSFHDKSEVMKTIIDLGIMESVLCQYNLLDNSNEQAINYARSKGLGVVVMGPIGGGRLVGPQELFKDITPDTKSTPELALRYVLSNQDVSCALSGMGDLAMVLENTKTASSTTALSYEELTSISEKLEQVKRLSELYCTGCNYCLPCPKEIKIPTVFYYLNLMRVYKLSEAAKSKFKEIGTNPYQGAHPSECIACGECEKKCPQNIKIIAQLKEAIAELS